MGLLHGTSVYGRDQGKLAWRGEGGFHRSIHQGHTHPGPLPLRALPLSSILPSSLLSVVPVAGFLTCVSIITRGDP